MNNREASYNVQPPSRRAIYRAAKRLLIREARRAWRAPVRAIARRVRAYLRGKSRAYLLRLIRRPAMALAVVTALATGSPAYASGEVDLSLVSVGIGGFVTNGVEEDDRSGASLSGAGDVNGDGIPDIIIGARRADPGGRTNAGQAYVVFGKADTTPVNLSDVASGSGGFVINGIDPYDNAGSSVSGIGDMNGDGLTDFIVGAGGADPGGREDAGESYVVFGKADGTSVDISDVASGTGGFVINGIDPSDRASTVSGAGDVNGDGVPDVIIGARLADSDGNTRAGECYVVFGKASTSPVNLSDVASGTGGFLIIGNYGEDYTGASVSGAGDVNGDGLDDVIVGVPGKPFFDAGGSYVVFGKDTTTSVHLADVASGVGGFHIDGVGFTGLAGASVSGAGDVNGDGLDDVIVGAPFAHPDRDRLYAGKSYVVFGKTDDTLAVDPDDVESGIGGFAIIGSVRGGFAGRVSGAGDVNGDGFADVIVGAPNAYQGGIAQVGVGYIVFGKPDTTAIELADVSAGFGGIVIRGIDEDDFSGATVSDVGDMNGDGFADVLIGAPGSSIIGGVIGKSYVVFGAAEVPEIPASGGLGHALMALLLASTGALTFWRLRKRGRSPVRSLD